MSVRDLIPFRERRNLARENPLAAILGRDFDPYFDDWSSLLPSRFASQAERVLPRVNVSENPEAWRVTAELPGMDEKDIRLHFEGNLLVLSGHKAEEKEEKGREFYRRERTSGEFQRAIELPAGIDMAKTSATFSKGVLSIDVPKKHEALSTRRTIEIRPG